jgi:hypothetical protein
MKALRVALLLGLGMGCGVPPDPNPCELELGTAGEGGAGFVAMPSTAVLAPGAQGGFHVWLGYRIKNAPPGTVKAAHTVRRESDSKLLSRGERKLEVGLAGDDGFWTSEMATPAFLCPSPLGVSVIDVPAVFEVTLTDEAGEQLDVQQVKTTLTCPEDAQKDFCLRICAG